jgi:hypothetical protein
VVNRGSRLKLEELDVTLQNTALTKTLTSDVGTARASGMFFIVTLRVRNKLPDPTPFDDSQNQVALDVDGKHYTENFDAENMPGGPYGTSFVWGGNADNQIQPDAEKTGTVIFDVPTSAVRKLTSTKVAPALYVSNFSGVDTPNLKRVGVIRLYN